MILANDAYDTRDYWMHENVKYAKASFRLRKCAKLIKKLAAGKECSLLDLGCGPAALRTLLAPNIRYFGIDIAVHEATPYLKELNMTQQAISFENRRFDYVVAMGLLEYLGGEQKSKFYEIRDILKDDGRFLMSYINFEHCRRIIWPNYNNVQSVAEMKASLNEVFVVEKCFPASHHWRQKQPGKYLLPALQMHMDFSIPFFSRSWAVEYMFICSKRS
jgi:cyclopropane fatty-acyl-phospholipid synthase-like methyltransferase